MKQKFYLYREVGEKETPEKGDEYKSGGEWHNLFCDNGLCNLITGSEHRRPVKTFEAEAPELKEEVETTTTKNDRQFAAIVLGGFSFCLLVIAVLGFLLLKVYGFKE
jgi:hypothetical protein